MSVELNHTIVHCRDRQRSARFLAEILGRPAPGRALVALALDAGWDAHPLGPSLSDGRDRITAVAAAITREGLDAVRKRHGLAEAVCAPAARRAAA